MCPLLQSITITHVLLVSYLFSYVVSCAIIDHHYAHPPTKCRSSQKLHGYLPNWRFPTQRPLSTTPIRGVPFRLSAHLTKHPNFSRWFRELNLTIRDIFFSCCSSNIPNLKRGAKNTRISCITPVQPYWSSGTNAAGLQSCEIIDLLAHPALTTRKGFCKEQISRNSRA